jgi:Tectonin domain
MSLTNIRFVLCLTLICCTAAAAVPASAQHFQQIPTPLSQISAGRKEVWGLKFPGGLIYRLVPGKGVTSADFQQVGGSLSQIAVGGGSLFQPDQVWGVNGAGVFSFNLSTNAYT